jgi:hypothetical protein
MERVHVQSRLEARKEGKGERMEKIWMVVEYLREGKYEGRVFTHYINLLKK